jgi:alkylation response protein AidB-like acyl-CoA dehydrogenase
MQHEIHPEIALVRDSARGFVSRHADRRRLRAIRQTVPGYDQAIVAAMAEQGWLGVLIPERHGGLGLGFAAMAAVLEELGRGLIGEPVCALAVLAARVILHGDGPSCAQLLPGIASGQLVAAVAWEEVPGGIDAAACRTRASHRAGGVHITGEKHFIVGDASARGFVVSARAEDGIGLYWVAMDRLGVSLSQEWRADGTPICTLHLDHVALDDADVVAYPAVGLAALQRALDEAAVMAGAELVGVMSGGLDLTLDYMRTRVQFDSPIGGFQALQHRAVDLHTQRELAGAAVGGAVAALDRGIDGAALSRLASRVKARCSAAALRIARESIQLHGAIGFTDECDIGLFLKRSLVLSAWLGNADAHRRRFAGLGAPIMEREATSEKRDAGAALLRTVMDKPQAERGWDDLPDDDFRAMCAAFFEGICPHDLRFLPHRPRLHVVKNLYHALSEPGWLAPAWPVRFGGMGLSPGKLIIYFEEWGRVGLPRLPDQGINNVASVLIARGTEAQQQYYLPRVLSGEHIWCQGYSEPNAGSDLASLRTEARLDGDEFVINGSKIWTTLAHDANHIYALVRTDKSVKKQAGLSFILIDMRQPGITVRPIRNISGEDEFCQVFFDDVRTPRSNLVGKLNDGWTVAKTLLGFERNKEGSPRQSMLALQRLESAATELRLTDDPVFIDRLTQLTFDVLDQAALYERFAEGIRNGAAPGFQVSMMKVWASETLQGLTEALVDCVGSAGSIEGAQRFGETAIDVLAPFYDSRAFTIFGGTNQIQRNIIAKRVLGL